MPSDNENRGFSFTLTVEGRLATMRGVQVPEGVIAAPDIAAVSSESREATAKAIDITAGIYEFAKLGNRPDPRNDAK